MENKSLTQAQVATVLAAMFIYLYVAYQLVYYAIFFYVLKDFNGLTILGPIIILALKFRYVKSYLQVIKTPQSVSLSSLSTLFVITLIYEVVVAVATATLFHSFFNCSSLACGVLAFLFIAQVIEFVLFSGVTFSLWPHIQQIKSQRGEEA